MAMGEDENLSAMKELKFIHITKCGGEVVEQIGKEKSSISWGKFDSEYEEGIKSAPPPWSMSWWLYPPQYMEDSYLARVLEKYDFFTVVRNPYDRIVSEYYCKWGGPVVKSQNVEDFNQFLNERLQKLKYDIQNNAKLEGHYIPQHMYLFSKSGESICNNIIKFENMISEFNELMERYSYDFIRMEENEFSPTHIDHIRSHKNPHHSQGQSQRHFMVQDLSPENVELVRELYREDFELLGYDPRELCSAFVERNRVLDANSAPTIVYPLPNRKSYTKTAPVPVSPAVVAPGPGEEGAQVRPEGVVEGAAEGDGMVTSEGQESAGAAVEVPPAAQGNAPSEEGRKRPESLLITISSSGGKTAYHTRRKISLLRDPQEEEARREKRPREVTLVVDPKEEEQRDAAMEVEEEGGDVRSPGRKLSRTASSSSHRSAPVHHIRLDIGPQFAPPPTRKLFTKGGVASPTGGIPAAPVPLVPADGITLSMHNIQPLSMNSLVRKYVASS